MIVILDNIKGRPSTRDMIIQLAIPMEHAAMVTPLLGKLGQHIAVAFADLDKAAAITFDAESSSLPTVGAGASIESAHRRSSGHVHGHYAQQLFQKGFFRAPKVVEQLGLAVDAPQDLVAKELALSLGHESIGDVSPDELTSWARESGLSWLLPKNIRTR